MNDPILTISVPTYNRPENLAVLYESFLRKVLSNYPNQVEILVCDNSDMVMAEKNHSLLENSGIVYIKNQTNIGFSGNVIKCVKEAHGKYLWIISDDDYIDYEAFEKFMEKMPDFIAEEVGCIMLPFLNSDAFGRKYLWNNESQWGVKGPCSLNDLIESYDQFPFVLFSSAVISREKCSESELEEVQERFTGNDFIQIPLFLNVVRLDTKLDFYESPLQQYKAADSIRFNIKQMYSSMMDIIDHYLGPNDSRYRRYCRRNYRLWLGWSLWDRTGLISVLGASSFRMELASNLFRCISFNNFILTMFLVVPKSILRWGYILYISISTAISNRQFSLSTVRNNIAMLNSKG